MSTTKTQALELLDAIETTSTHMKHCVRRTDLDTALQWAERLRMLLLSLKTILSDATEAHEHDEGQ
jgi:hypothetical protein